MLHRCFPPWDSVSLRERGTDSDLGTSTVRPMLVASLDIRIICRGSRERGKLEDKTVRDRMSRSLLRGNGSGRIVESTCLADGRDHQRSDEKRAEKAIYQHDSRRQLRAITTRRDRVILVAEQVKMRARVVTQSKVARARSWQRATCSAKLKLRSAGLLSVEPTSQCGTATATPRRGVLHPGKSKPRSVAAHMIDMTYIWANAAVLMAAFLFVQVRLRLFAPGYSNSDRGHSGTAVDIKDWRHVLDWKLKAGSHPFPGRSGGTCVNEAALIAAGFDYRPIRSAEEMPASFSRPICQLAMILNDTATDEERQRLLPYVETARVR